MNLRVCQSEYLSFCLLEDVGRDSLMHSRDLFEIPGAMLSLFWVLQMLWDENTTFDGCVNRYGRSMVFDS